MDTEKLNITEKMIDSFFGVVKRLIPSYDGSFGLPESFVDMLKSIIESVAWFLPLNVLVPMFLITLGINLLNIGWKIFLRIKSFIPTMGD